MVAIWARNGVPMAVIASSSNMSNMKEYWRAQAKEIAVKAQRAGYRATTVRSCEIIKISKNRHFSTARGLAGGAITRSREASNGLVSPHAEPLSLFEITSQLLRKRLPRSFHTFLRPGGSGPFNKMAV